MARLKISNRDARRVFLSASGLARAPIGELNLGQLVHELGFVQLDAIQVVARAHHHILWSRNQNYREPMLGHHMANDRQVFEHFTHDASVIPMEFYPLWQRQFRRLEHKTRQYGWHRAMDDLGGIEALLNTIRASGPLSTKSFETKIEGERRMWDRPPHKRALEHLWYSGHLTTSHRENFIKFYDLADRIIPESLRLAKIDDATQLDELCRAAIRRIGFGTSGDIQRFWDAADSGEVKEWAARNSGSLVPVSIEAADGTSFDALAPEDIEQTFAQTPSPTTRLRILNPFDPAIRDRSRLARFFGFDYRMEMFVPEAKRRWGYYVYPLLEGDRFVGRIEVKANRREGWLKVLNLWKEPSAAWTNARQVKLRSELDRLARFVGVKVSQERLDETLDADRLSAGNEL
ncbi:MAG: crosslink repair DNA glycosylase YcaQ family protein [Pseudomonadota bacterium]